MGLHRLTGGPTHPQNPGSSPSSHPGPAVEVVIESPCVTEIRTDPDSPVVVIEHDGAPELVWVVEPATSPAGLGVHLDDLVDVAGFAAAPADVPLVLRRGPDGVVRPVPQREPWGDEIRYRAGPPTGVEDVPVGAVQIDTTTGRGYRLHETGV
jgi:hypothetical protein